MNDLKMHSHMSSGKHEDVAAGFVILRFLGFFAAAIDAGFLLFDALDFDDAAIVTGAMSRFLCGRWWNWGLGLPLF